MSALDLLVGSWDLTTDNVNVDRIVTGSQHYERTLDGAFVRLDWHYDDPDFPDAIALIDETRYHYFDVRGVIRVFDYVLGDRGYELTWLDPEFSQHQLATFVSDDEVEIVGEASRDGGATWVHDFRTTLRRRA